MLKNPPSRETSLVAQWQRVYLPMRVWSLVQEDVPCRGASKPLCHRYWACMMPLLKPVHPGAYALLQRKSPLWEAYTPHLESSACSLQLEKALPQKRRPSTIKRKETILTYSKNPLCDAGDMGLAPGWETKIPRAADQLSSASCNYLSLCATTRELTCCNERTKTQNIQIHTIKKKKSSFPPCR